MKYSAALLLLLALPLHADVATQTDWSGGPGQPGPLTGFLDGFISDTGMDWWEVTGELTLTPFFQCDFDDGFSDTAPADIDGDGDADIAVLYEPALTLTWWENTEGDGRNWVIHPIVNVPNDTVYLVCADLDSDGDEDLVTSGLLLTWYENDGSGQSWTSHLIDNPGGDLIWHVDTGDIDLDGHIDIVGMLYWSNEVVWWENPSPGDSWQRNVVDPDFPHPRSVLCTDVDGDGLDDVVAAPGYDSSDFTWWRNLGGSAWSEHLIGPLGIGISLADIDMDGDGDKDIAAGSGFIDGIMWYSNEDGSGEDWTTHVVDGDFWPNSISLFDLDGDGDYDVLGSGGLDGVAIWLNQDGLGNTWVRQDLSQAYDAFANTAFSDFDNDGSLEFCAGGAVEAIFWDPDDPLLSGELISSIVYVNDADWLGISWTEDTSIGTAVTFQVRASDDYTQMGEWSDTLTVPCSLDGILEDYDSFLQYRAILSRSEPGLSPILYDVTFTWNPLGIEHGEAPSAVELRIGPNPSPGSPSIVFGLPSAVEVCLLVYDMAGRVVASVEPAAYDAGWHSESLGELASGVYFVRMTAGEFEASERFVVIE